MATLVSACLVRSGTVPPGYDADDFTADSAARFRDLASLPSALQNALASCSEDPSGLLGTDGR